ncbi:hypothetical protein [Pseudoalteromonas luteoviolacea]|uniref:Uncharacterized protein n=1 Tax=Pseudoalteromonas luteoviolacea H33 TaxID=1365251 RepID=A0A167BFG2_9GAMM|nr:hypothetical protein [Pseudoalteromonas luteoviolacea]KZN46481.1 hypothetical protein N476_24450 [Pseudoalteromonas luteoviolacea H33]KZN79207.1 hypothetical protein N477_06040 [Pseudoalteromonas luteoviolacea H33-S]MBQ4878683.1 hypothetical protein [Pseudoalteromonas luteoviolacea]MBQ4907223.1 hypothetical protein [Pseudoalteromonas luteoviolacea]
MKNSTILALALTTGFFANSAFSAELVCRVNSLNGQSHNSGTSNCWAMDFSFRNSSSGVFYLKDVTKPIERVQWNNNRSCSGTQCAVTVRSFQYKSMTAHIFYKDGTSELTNRAVMLYENGM